MKEWQELLNHIDQYIYIEAEEEIIIKHGPGADEALAAYERGLTVLVEGNSKDGMERRMAKYSELAKWEYDIALDCVRRMSDEDRAYVCKHMQTTEYHFGYAMGIRNKYIHPAQKHSYFEADGISSSVMQKIFSLLNPVYDFRNGKITGFYEDFSMSHLLELYGDSHSKIFEEIVEKLAKGEDYSSAEEAIKELKEKLRSSLGEDEFIRIFRRAMQDYDENESQNDREDWYWETNFPACKAVLYPLQSNQMNVLRRMRFFAQVENRGIKSLKECREYIDEKLGLREDYADYMARCAWEVCNPVTTGKWRDLSLYQLDIDFSMRWKLERKGIKTMGDLCDRSFEQLARIPEIGSEGTLKIKEELEGMGLTLALGVSNKEFEEDGDDTGAEIVDVLSDLGFDEELPFN